MLRSINLLLLLALLLSPALAFTAMSPLPSSRLSSASPSTRLYGGKKAKFGVASPAVYAAKLALGEKPLNTLRGKAISLHSQLIGDFCKWSGSYHLRTRVIKKAKVNGDTLGFLV